MFGVCIRLNKVKLYYSYSNTFKTIELNLNPILSINYDLKLNQKIERRERQ